LQLNLIRFILEVELIGGLYIMADQEKKTVEVSSTEDIEKNKVNAVLSYLGILIIVPLLSEDAKKSPFAQFHLNQGLVLLIAGAVGGFVFWIPFIGWAAAIFFFVIWLMGIIGAAQGQMNKVPLLGDIKLIK
jgi:uncharacterized membrane protein